MRRKPCRNEWCTNTMTPRARTEYCQRCRTNFKRNGTYETKYRTKYSPLVAPTEKQEPLPRFVDPNRRTQVPPQCKSVSPETGCQCVLDWVHVHEQGTDHRHYGTNLMLVKWPLETQTKETSNGDR